MKNSKKLTYMAMFTALITIVTMISIKIPVTNGGYVHLGDSLIYISSVFLGPVYGMIVAGIGSMLADILLGAANYAPFTLVIKALMGLVCGLIVYRNLTTKRFVIGSVVGGFIMLVGYFLTEYLFMGNFVFPGIQLAFNSLQLVFGVIAGCLIYLALKKVSKKELNHYFDEE